MASKNVKTGRGHGLSGKAEGPDIGGKMGLSGKAGNKNDHRLSPRHRGQASETFANYRLRACRACGSLIDWRRADGESDDLFARASASLGDSGCCDGDGAGRERLRRRTIVRLRALQWHAVGQR